MIQKVDLKKEVNAVEKLFEYKRLGTLNDHMLNVLQAENRTLDFHIHESSDEGTLNEDNTGGAYTE